jgi:hypothetical protein
MPETSFDHSIRMAATLKAIGYGTLAVGLLDAGDGVAFLWLSAGKNPVQVLQYIASGALGDSAFSGGLMAAGIGLLLHFLISLVVVALFVAAYQRSETVRNWASPVGLVYGITVWLVMNLIVLPLSGVPRSPIRALVLCHGLIGHALFVGLPTALAARRWSITAS